MVRLDEVRARVAASYDRLGMPTWPDPHPGGGQPREEEYSRLTAPERYGVVHARARVWADVLGELSGVAVEVLPPGPLEGTDGFDRGVRITSSRPGTLPLLLLERDAPHAVLHLGVTAPGTVMLPDCGCDACDSGSADLLDVLDERVGAVVGGPFVLLRRSGWHAEWHPGGGSSGGTTPGPDHTEAMTWCRRLAAGEDVPLPPGTEALVGRSWLG